MNKNIQKISAKVCNHVQADKSSVRDSSSMFEYVRAIKQAASSSYEVFFSHSGSDGATSSGEHLLLHEVLLEPSVDFDPSANPRT